MEAGIAANCAEDRDGQNHDMLMILKSKSNHLNKGDLKSKSKSFWKWWFENQNQIENQIILKYKLYSSNFDVFCSLTALVIILNSTDSTF